MNQHIPKQGKISVFLLEDHEIFRRGIRDLLAAEPDIDLVGEAGTASSALARMPALRPDVAILDVRLPDGDGISVCREICSTLPGTACLMLTGYGGDQALLGAILAGAAGYVSKQTCGTDLLSALRTVASGKSILDPHASGQMMARLRERTLGADPVAALTEQEKRVLELIGEGLSNRQIAQRMVLAEKTVKNYVSSVLTKLGMQSRTQAAAFSARHSDDRDEYGELVTVTPDRARREHRRRPRPLAIAGGSAGQEPLAGAGTPAPRAYAGSCVRSALQPSRPVTPSSLSPTTRPWSVMAALFSVIRCGPFRILTTLTARPSTDSCSMYRRSMTLSNKNMSPSSDWAVIPPPVVSLVASKETPAARTSPTRLRM
jgi:DNA-binding NarL/FixJ family response regulator